MRLVWSQALSVAASISGCGAGSTRFGWSGSRPASGLISDPGWPRALRNPASWNLAWTVGDLR
jgi:hypothetical protein